MPQGIVTHDTALAAINTVQNKQDAGRAAALAQLQAQIDTKNQAKAQEIAQQKKQAQTISSTSKG